MRKIVNIILFVTLILGARNALGQRRSGFSDWNVPPPILPGGLKKGGVTNDKIKLQPPADVPAPVLDLDPDFKLLPPAQVGLTPTDVEVPGQPLFPAMPFAVVEIPSPSAPKIIELPLKAPQDEVTEGATDMPLVQEPEMPELPKMPVVVEGQASDAPNRLPLIPSILKQPVPELITDTPFPFTEWPVPPIPLTIHLTVVLPGEADDNKPLPKALKKPKGKPSKKRAKKHS